jgi:hypothetical protein
MGLREDLKKNYNLAELKAEISKHNEKIIKGKKLTGYSRLKKDALVDFVMKNEADFKYLATKKTTPTKAGRPKKKADSPPSSVGSSTKSISPASALPSPSPTPKTPKTPAAKAILDQDPGKLKFLGFKENKRREDYATANLTRIDGTLSEQYEPMIEFELKRRMKDAIADMKKITKMIKRYRKLTGEEPTKLIKIFKDLDKEYDMASTRLINELGLVGYVGELPSFTIEKGKEGKELAPGEEPPPPKPKKVKKTLNDLLLEQMNKQQQLQSHFAGGKDPYAPGGSLA